MLMERILNNEKSNQPIKKKLQANVLNTNISNSNSIGPKIFFIVPENSLLEQQVKAIEDNICKFRVAKIVSGKTDKITSSKRDFNLFMSQYDIFVSTPEIIYRFLYTGLLNISNIRLLVFDECHHTDLNHPYNILMNEFYFFYQKHDKSVKLPQILGLTASPIKKNFNNINALKITSELINFCENMDCFLVMDPDVIEYKIEKGNDDIEKISPDEANRDYIQMNNFTEDENYNKLVNILEKNLFYPLLDLTKLDNDNKEEYRKLITILMLSEDFQEFGTSLNGFQPLIKNSENDDNLKLIEKLIRQIYLLLENTNINCVLELLKDYRKEMSMGKRMNDIIDKMIIFLKNNKVNFNYESHRITLLRNYFLDTFYQETENKHRIIIFVDHRVVSNYLVKEVNNFFNEVFNSNKESNTKFKALNIVGVSNSKKSTVSLKNTLNELNEKLFLFNNGKCQVLIATSTVEEGIDIKECDTIIVYTELKTVKSYIQMKGRARKKNAQFVMFTYNIEQTKSKIQNFVDIIKLIRSKFVNKSFVVDLRRNKFLEKKVFDIYKEFPNSKAKITLRNSAQIYNHIKNLLSRYNIKIDPILDYHEKQKVKDIEPKWKCYFSLTGGIEDINLKSEYYIGKNSSTSHAYLLFIAFLFDNGVIDDNFQIISVEFFRN